MSEQMHIFAQSDSEELILQDEIAICGILAQRSDAQLRAIAQAFPVQHKKSLSAMYVSIFITSRAVAQGSQA